MTNVGNVWKQALTSMMSPSSTNSKGGGSVNISASRTSSSAVPQSGSGYDMLMNPGAGGDDELCKRLCCCDARRFGADGGSCTSSSADAVQLQGATKANRDRRNAEFAQLMRLQRLYTCELMKPECDLVTLQNLLTQGVPCLLRARVWQLLLGYIPPKNSRVPYPTPKPADYIRLVETVYSPIEACGDRGKDPLCVMLQQIKLDVLRTHPTGLYNIFNIRSIQLALERILFLWAATNSKISYFQGLNEIPTMFIAVFLHSYLLGRMDQVNTLSPEAMIEIEADVYYCTTKLLEKYYPPGESRPLHAEVLLNKLDDILTKTNKPIAEHFSRLGMTMYHFGFSWATCLLLREYSLPDSIALWDFIIATGSAGTSADIFPFLFASYLSHFSGLLELSMDQVMHQLQLPLSQRDNPPIATLIKEARALQQTYNQTSAQD
ncbi:TBC1 domain family member 22A [Pelomyxa schiedti]|nr:TBC1 domain family member 22A [Pelomyxa schiedti]